METLSKMEVEVLIHQAKSPLKELLILGFGSGLRLEEAIGITKSNITRNKVILKDREIIVPEHVHKALYELAQKSGNRLFNYDASYLSHVIPEYAFQTIKRPIDWKTIRRTYINLASQANFPIKLIISNTGTTYETCAPYLTNGVEHSRTVIEIVLFKG